MCGLFGFVGRAPDMRELIAIAEQTAATRGWHAWGMAWIDDRGRLRSYKAPGRLDRCTLAEAAGARALIGHCRLATHGSAEANANNHPHGCDGGWLVHNGVIWGHQQVARANGLLLQTECDSEVLARLVEASTETDRCGQLSWAIETAMGETESPCAVMGLWHDQLVVGRAGNPLAYTRRREGTYIASLAKHLPGSPKEFTDWEVDSFPVAK